MNVGRGDPVCVDIARTTRWLIKQALITQGPENSDELVPLFIDLLHPQSCHIRWYKLKEVIA